MNCAICQDKITNEFCTLNCGCKYVYHSKCIKTWFKRDLSCPTCRKKWKKKKKANTELIDEINRRLHLESIGINSTRMYATNWNVLRIMSGMAGLTYTT